jgi:hypothetical protein
MFISWSSLATRKDTFRYAVIRLQRGGQSQVSFSFGGPQNARLTEIE